MSDPAGWYAQPEGQQSYWDGRQWTHRWVPGVGPMPWKDGEASSEQGAGQPSQSASAQPPWGPGLPTAPLEGKGFFASLFDFGFTSFITMQLLSSMYGTFVVLVVVASGVAIGAGIHLGGAFMFAIVVVPIVALGYLVLARVSMEMIALFFRIGENTTLMVASSTGPGINKGAAGFAYGPAQGPTMTPAVHSPPLADQRISAAAPVTPAAATQSYCRHSPSERTIFGVDREHGSEICLGCGLPYWPGSPNSLLAPNA